MKEETLKAKRICMKPGKTNQEDRLNGSQKYSIGTSFHKFCTDVPIGHPFMGNAL